MRCRVRRMLFVAPAGAETLGGLDQINSWGERDPGFAVLFDCVKNVLPAKGACTIPFSNKFNSKLGERTAREKQANGGRGQKCQANAARKAMFDGKGGIFVKVTIQGVQPKPAMPLPGIPKQVEQVPASGMGTWLIRMLKMPIWMALMNDPKVCNPTLGELEFNAAWSTACAKDAPRLPTNLLPYRARVAMPAPIWSHHTKATEVCAQYTGNAVVSWHYTVRIIYLLY